MSEEKKINLQNRLNRLKNKISSIRFAELEEKLRKCKNDEECDEVEKEIKGLEKTIQQKSTINKGIGW
jgi:peptidoglycan hydrolase CwlO-like protein